MSYYGGGGTGGGGGTNDHRLLAGRSDANQHPAAAVSVASIAPLDAETGTVQQALEMLAARFGAEEIAPIAAAQVGAYKAVAFRADGRIEPAGHDNPAHLSHLAGVTLASVTTGAVARVSVNSLVRFSGWNWTPGAPVFVGKNGDLTQTPPASGFAQPIGNAIASDAIQVRVGPAVRRGA